jgi:hypothetical protein
LAWQLVFPFLKKIWIIDKNDSGALEGSGCGSNRRGFRIKPDDSIQASLAECGFVGYICGFYVKARNFSRIIN